MSCATFQVVSDSCCDLPKELAEKHDIAIVPMYVAFSDGVYQRDYYDFTAAEFYRRMQEHPGDYPKTSLPSVEDYIKAWEPYVAGGTPVLNISLTSKMSGSYNSARMAREEMLEKYPDAQIEVLDSASLTVLEGLIVLEACRLRDEGKTLSEAMTALNEIKKHGRAYFTIGELSYLAKGGRIGGLIKLAAVGMGIKPVVLFKDGAISLCKITRNRQKSLRELAHQAALYFVKNKENPADYHLLTGHGLSPEDGEEINRLFREELSSAGFTGYETPEKVQIGTMVGAHNGPMLMGIAFLKREEALA